MQKLISILVAAMFAAVTFNAVAAEEKGKGDEKKAAAKKGDEKKKADEKKAPAK